MTFSAVVGRPSIVHAGFAIAEILLIHPTKAFSAVSQVHPAAIVSAVRVAFCRPCHLVVTDEAEPTAAILGPGGV